MKIKEKNFRIRFKEEEGRSLKFEVVVIEEGLSKNNRFYPAETLKASIDKFEGARIAYYEAKDLFDHLPDSVRHKNPDGFPKQVVGVLRNVRFGETSKGTEGLIAEAHLIESAKWLCELLQLSLKQGIDEAIGFSIDCLGESETRKDEGKEIDYITEISQVNELTVVTNPAAGGRVERLVASYNQTKEKKEMKEALLKLLAHIRPGSLDKLSLTESEEKEVADAAKDAIGTVKDEMKEGPAVVAALDAVLAAIEAGDMEAVKAGAMKALEEYKKFVADKKEPNEPAAATEPPAAAAPANESAKLQKQLEALMKRLDAKEASQGKLETQLQEAMINRKLAESKLPSLSQDRLRKQFSGSSLTESAVDVLIKEEREYASRLIEARHEGGITSISVGQERVDKIGDAIEGMIAGEDINKIPRFRSFKEAYSKTTGVSPFSSRFTERMWADIKKGRPSHQRLTEDVDTSQLGEILADRIHKQMVKEYNVKRLDDWRKFADVSDAPDFLTQRRTRLGGYGTNMPAVLEGASYTDLTSPTDEEATYAVGKRGGLETLTFEAVKNDNLSKLRDIPKRMGRGAASTLKQFVFEFINPATNANIYDSNPLYDAAHANIGTAALDDTSLNLAIIRMMDQAAYNEANLFVQAVPKYLVVPNEEYKNASQLVESRVEVGTSNRTHTVDNFWSRFGIEVVPVPYWTDNNNWVLAADKMEIPIIEVGFLDGREEPEIFQEAPNTGEDFTNDHIRYKLRHIYGGAVLDWRGLDGSVVV